LESLPRRIRDPVFTCRLRPAGVLWARVSFPSITMRGGGHSGGPLCYMGRRAFDP